MDMLLTGVTLEILLKYRKTDAQQLSIVSGFSEYPASGTGSALY
jgi:hypothetical protein